MGANLIKAAKGGDVDTVKSLLQRGADPNKKNLVRGDSALHWAAIMGHTNVATALLRAGAHPNIRDQNGDTPLQYASRGGCLSVVKALLDAGADPNIQGVETTSSNLNSALFEAASKGHVDVATALLQAGADPYLRTRSRLFESGETPLGIAEKNGNQAMVRLLKKRGKQDHADPSELQTTKGGQSPVSLTRRSRMDGIEQWLKEVGSERYISLFRAFDTGEDGPLTGAVLFAFGDEELESLGIENRLHRNALLTSIADARSSTLHPMARLERDVQQISANADFLVQKSVDTTNAEVEELLDFE